MDKDNPFTKIVRNGKVKQPTQKGFDPIKWKFDFTNLKQVSELDRKLFHSGLHIYEWLSRIRKELCKFPESKLPKSTLLRVYVAIVNRDYCVGDRQTSENLVKNPGQVISGSNIRIKVGGIDVDFDSYIEAAVTALKYPLYEVYKLDENEQHGKIERNQEELLKNFRMRTQLAASYNEIEQIWGDCLWLDWNIVEEKDEVRVLPPISTDYIHSTVAQARIDNLNVEHGSHFFIAWKTKPQYFKELFFKHPRIIGIKKNKKNRKLVLGKLSEYDAPPHSYVGQLLAEERYWRGLLDEPLPKLENLSIRRILDAWDVIVSLGVVLESKFPQYTGVKSIQQFFSYSELIPLSEIRFALKKAEGFSENELDAIIELITFSNIRDDLWLRPVVNVGDGNCLLVVPAILIPNIIRSIEFWLKVGGLDLDSRGSIFESDLQTEVEYLISSAPYKLNSQSIGPQKIEVRDTFEQIDLMWRVGNKLYVCEVKCNIYPATPIERFRFNMVLKEAAEQAKRKSDFVSKNRKLILEKYFADISIDEFYPLVITNRYLGAGLPINDVPITDLSLLEAYFRGFQNFFVPGKGAEIGEAGYRHIYFENSNEAVENLLSYLKFPAGILILYKLLDTRVLPLPKLSDEKLRTISYCYVNYDQLSDFFKILTSAQFD